MIVLYMSGGMLASKGGRQRGSVQTADEANLAKRWPKVMDKSARELRAGVSFQRSRRTLGNASSCYASVKRATPSPLLKELEEVLERAAQEVLSTSEMRSDQPQLECRQSEAHHLLEVNNPFAVGADNFPGRGTDSLPVHQSLETGASVSSAANAKLRLADADRPLENLTGLEPSHLHNQQFDQQLAAATPGPNASGFASESPNRFESPGRLGLQLDGSPHIRGSQASVYDSARSHDAVDHSIGIGAESSQHIVRSPAAPECGDRTADVDVRPYMPAQSVAHRLQLPAANASDSLTHDDAEQFRSSPSTSSVCALEGFSGDVWYWHG